MPDFDLKALSDVADVRMGQSPLSSSCSEEPCGLPFLQGCAEFGARHPSPKLYCDPPLRTANAESILISVRAPVGDMNIADQDYCIGRGLGAVNGTHADTSFLFYSMEHHRRQLQRVAQGSTFEAIGSRELRGMRLPIPSRPIQERIAKILTTVDNQIEKTEELIAKYQAIKQGMMHDLFTRGVDEHGRLRPSRDEAPQLYKESELGWIPKDWRQDRLGGVCTWRSGGTPSRSNPDFWSGSVPWASPKDMKVLDLADTEEHVSKQGAEYGSRMVDVGTVFIVIRGMILAHTFPVAVAATKMAFNQDLKALECDRDVDHRFLAFWLLDHASKLLALATASTHGTKRYDMKDLYAVAIGVPKPGEQEQIVQRLDAADHRIQTEKAHLHKLRMLKLGLMQDLLTGKVPVKPQPPDQDGGNTPSGSAKAGVKTRREGVHA
jgi:type I restriction enzyme S subunit